MKNRNPSEVSPVEVVFDLISGKYKGAIIWYLAQERNLRYGEIYKRLPKVNAKMLAEQLKELEADGLISKVIYPEVPPHVEYALTDLGMSLYQIVEVAHIWGVQYVCSLPPNIAPITNKTRWCYLNPNTMKEGKASD